MCVIDAQDKKQPEASTLTNVCTNMKTIDSL